MQWVVLADSPSEHQWHKRAIGPLSCWSAGYHNWCPPRHYSVGDRLVLRQALINLVDNAIKYTPVAGHIRIHVSESPAGAVLRAVHPVAADDS